MMVVIRQKMTAAVIAGLLCSASVVPAAPRSLRMPGAIAGFVADSGGIPQMGATVLLFDRYDKLLTKVLTNEKGSFGFHQILPDIYSVRVSLASFVPAAKRNIAVLPGLQAFLTINLASIFSSVELVYSTPGQGALMSDDWKWVLRSSMSTRPILRILPNIDISDPSARRRLPVFSETSGMVRVSASDMGAVSSGSGEPDLGTAFALATSVYGSSHLQLSGNVGYSAQGGTPAAGFSTSFAPTIAGVAGPSVNVTMRQLFLPSRVGAAFVGGQREGTPGLRTMSVSLAESRQLTDNLVMDCGMTLESVTFLDHLNFFSPYVRLDYNLGEAGNLEFGFSSGVPPTQKTASNASSESELQRDLATLSAFPRVSRRGGRAHVQRAENFEAGYKKSIGQTTISIGGYHERITNAALAMEAPAGLYSADDQLSDPFSSSYIFNIGTFSRFGLSTSVTQNLNEHLSATVAVGNNGVMTAGDRTLDSSDPEQLRSLIKPGHRMWASAKLSGTSPWTGTKFVSSYQWTDYSTLTAGHRYLTQRLGPEPGLNVQVRQPIGSVPGISGRLEATAEIRNALAQGYLPITTADNQRLVLIQSPRSIRGGLSFIF